MTRQPKLFQATLQTSDRLWGWAYSADHVVKVFPKASVVDISYEIPLLTEADEINFDLIVLWEIYTRKLCVKHHVN